MNLLKINKLSFSYDEYPLFCIEDLSFGSKSIVKLEGMNGSGKTTFLGLLSDCLNVSPKECSFSFQGKEYQDFSVLRPHRIFVNDQFYFYENLTVKEQISFFSYLLNFGKDFHKNAEEYCKNLGLSIYWKKKIKELSLGTKQKLYLACLLAVEVPFYFLDEPFNSIDSESKEIVREIIMKKFRTKSTCLIIIVSHETTNDQLFTHILRTSNWKIVIK